MTKPNQHLQAGARPLTLTIRAAEPADCDGMAKLSRQLGYESSGDDVRGRLVQMHDSSQYAVFVAESGESGILGWIGLNIFRSVETPPMVEISGLVVDEATRSRGVGKQLVEAAEAWARKLGYSLLSVRCNVVRDRAHAFYLRNGFENTKTQKVFRKHLLPR